MAFSTYNDVIYLDAQDFTTTTGDNHDVAIASSNFHVTCTSNNDAITGIIPPMNQSGGQVWVTNVSSSNKLVIKNNVGSTSGYRFIMDADLTLMPWESQHFGLAMGTGWVVVGGAYQNHTLGNTWVLGARKKRVKDYISSATVSGGNAVFYLTDDGTSGGNAVFTDEVFIQSIAPQAFDNSIVYTYGTPSVSGDLKSITVAVQRLTNFLLGLFTFSAAANGTTVRLTVKGS